MNMVHIFVSMCFTNLFYITLLSSVSLHSNLKLLPSWQKMVWKESCTYSDVALMRNLDIPLFLWHFFSISCCPAWLQALLLQVAWLYLCCKYAIHFLLLWDAVIFAKKQIGDMVQRLKRHLISAQDLNGANTSPLTSPKFCPITKKDFPHLIFNISIFQIFLLRLFLSCTHVLLHTPFHNVIHCFCFLNNPVGEVPL